MASPADSHTSDYSPGQMPIAEQKATFNGVVGLFKWGSLATAALVALLVLWFCTPAGPVPGFVVAIVMTVLGVIVLREKPKAGH